MEDVFVKMADCGSGSVGTCITSLFIMKHNCIENLSHNVFSNKNSGLNNSKCLLEDKKYFSSSIKIDPSNDTLNACKNLQETSTICSLELESTLETSDNYKKKLCMDRYDSSESSDSVLCSLESTLEDSDNDKKKRCMDRYDSSESSDSGVLTGSTFSESSSNSGTSDITDPCSPYSVTSFHLGDDNGSPSSLPSKSSTVFSSNDLLVTSKMLPDNSPREEENEVPWFWKGYELTSDDIDVGVKNSNFFGINDEKNENIELRLNEAIPDVLDSETNFLYGKVFHSEQYDELPIFNEEKSQNLRDTNGNKSVTTTATKLNAATNKFVLNDNDPIEFFNILPSVFKNGVLHTNEYEEFDKRIVNDDCEVISESSLDAIAKPSFYRSKLEVPEVVNNVLLSSGCLNNNNNNNSNNINNNTVKVSQKDLEIKDMQRVTDTVTTYKKNIRFPSDKKSPFLTDRVCRWTDCVDHISSSTKLIEHLQSKHVNPQTFSETFICLWNGCKVFGRPSCSRSWLERHVLSHGGNKPYRCIVDNCGQRFSSQLMLERHINQHFKTPKEVNDGVVDATPKLIRRNGQKLRYRRQPYSVIRRRTDVFDAGTMSQLQYLLVQMAQRSKSVSLNVVDSKTFLHVTFQPKVIGSRQELNGVTKYLIRWYPYNTLEDEWLPKSEIENTRTVPIWKLPTSVQQLFWDSVFPNQRCKNVRQSRKYKPERSDI